MGKLKVSPIWESPKPISWERGFFAVFLGAAAGITSRAGFGRGAPDWIVAVPPVLFAALGNDNPFLGLGAIAGAYLGIHYFVAQLGITSQLVGGMAGTAAFYQLSRLIG